MDLNVTESNISGRHVSVFLVLPAFNKASVITQCIEGLILESQSAGLSMTIAVVDDASEDDTLASLAMLNIPEVTVAPLARNQGKGAALRHGIALAPEGVDYIGFFDADLDIAPQTVTNLVADLQANASASGAIASKVHPDSRVSYSRFRRVGSLVFSLVARGLIGVRFRDTQTGAKMFRSSVLKEISSQCTINGFAFDVELLGRAVRAGYLIIESPVDLRIHLGSTVSLRNVAESFRDLLRVRSALGDRNFP